MKTALLFILFSCLTFSQDIDMNRLERINIQYDSIGLPVTEEMIELDRVSDLGMDTFTKLLLNDNFKNPKLYKEILAKFNNNQRMFIISPTYKTSEKLEEAGQLFREAMLLKKAALKSKIMGEYYREKGRIIQERMDARLLQFFRETNFSVIEFNKLSEDEQFEKLDDFERSKKK